MTSRPHEWKPLPTHTYISHTHTLVEHYTDANSVLFSLTSIYILMMEVNPRAAISPFTPPLRRDAPERFGVGAAYQPPDSGGMSRGGVMDRDADRHGEQE